jgi:hypothetical protein
MTSHSGSGNVIWRTLQLGASWDLLLGERTSASRLARWGRIVCGIEVLPLAKQLVTVYALGQAPDVGVRDTTRHKVLAPPIDHLDDAQDLHGGLCPCVADEFAL